MLYKTQKAWRVCDDPPAGAICAFDRQGEPYLVVKGNPFPLHKVELGKKFTVSFKPFPPESLVEGFTTVNYQTFVAKMERAEALAKALRAVWFFVGVCRSEKGRADLAEEQTQELAIELIQARKKIARVEERLEEFLGQKQLQIDCRIVAEGRLASTRRKMHLAVAAAALFLCSSLFLGVLYLIEKGILGG